MHYAMVIKAGKTSGILTNEIMEYLISENNPVDVKMAVINKLGWDSDGKYNSTLFFNFLQKKRGYKDRPDLMENGSYHELLCLAYLRAMDNYFDPGWADEMALMALLKDPDNCFACRIISALIVAQIKLADSDWCGVYNTTDQVKNNTILKRDMKRKAVKIIFRYMDQYKEYFR